MSVVASHVDAFFPIYSVSTRAGKGMQRRETRNDGDWIFNRHCYGDILVCIYSNIVALAVLAWTVLFERSNQSYNHWCIFLLTQGNSDRYMVLVVYMFS